MKKNKIDIYICSVNELDEKNISFLEKNTLKYGYELARKKRRKQDKLLELAAYFLLKKYALIPNNIEGDIAINDYGKPFFKELPVFFNISHSNEYVCCAISDEEIGIDIQYIIEEHFGIHSLFHKNEIDKITNADKRSDLIFFNIWSSKEAYIKLLGISLFRGLKYLDFSDLHEGMNGWGGFYIWIEHFKDYVIACSSESDTIPSIHIVDLKGLR